MVVPLVASLLGAVTSNVVSVVIKLIGKRYELWSDFDNDIESIRRDLLMIAGDEEDQLSEEVDLSAAMGKYREEMHDLALEIEDFLDRILRHVVEKNGCPVHKALGFTTEPLLDAKVKKLKQRLKDAKQRRSDLDKQDIINGRQISHSWTPTANTYTTKIEPVGIDESKREICEWATKDVEGEPEQLSLSVVSIVGFSGSGKSTLAKAVYDCPYVGRKFPHRAWVLASKHSGDTKKILTELFKDLGQQDKICDSDDVEQLQAKISEYLKGTKRYLIVLDDIKNQTSWDGIKSAFPEKATGRIIVTTTIQRVAKVCSRGNGYVHTMAALDNKHSKELLKAVLKGHSPELERSSTSIMNKIDGHPHALVSFANHLQGEDRITKSVCEKLCSNLGFRMATEDAFKELQRALMCTYRSLPKDFLNLKTCLLYLCVFPNGCHISRSRLIRRWSAEGYVKHDHSRSNQVVAEDNFKKLVDQSTIWPIDTSKDANVKTCRAHSIFHEFLLYMSMSAKFITSFDNEDRRDYRHIIIQKTPNSKSGDDEEKSRAHSLTICGSAGEAVGYFSKCQLLRVLDLEECKDLEDKHLDGIHKLWYLKYLSVGDKISRLPKHIENLHCLETLDTRKTKEVIILPVEVIKLPHLAHLLGSFKLGKRDWDNSKPQNYVPEKSNLQTLAGFVTDNNPGFSKLMLYMKMLKKVKICCNSITDEGLDDLLVAIENFVQADVDTGLCVRSLSLDIRNFSVKILLSLAHGSLRSLKLNGELNGLVHFTTALWNLRELCLSSSNDLMEKDLADLRMLSDLESLRLDGVSLEGFVITSEDFPGLLRLCLVQCPSLPKIEEGALPNLLSLRLLNDGLDALSGIEIKRHKLLQEIALDSEVMQETKTVWEDAAKNHPKRPRVVYMKRVDVNDTGSMVKYVATERTVPATASSTMLGKRAISRVESNPVNKHSSSDSKHVKREDDHSVKEAIVANPSTASTEFCSAAMEMDIDMQPSSRVVSSSWLAQHSA